MTARSDNFNRADGTFNGSTPSDGGSAWSASSIWSIIGNQVGLSSAPGAREIALLETSATAGEVQCTMAVRRNSGPCVRAADVNNHVVLYALSGSFAIYKKVAGSYTQLGSTYTGTVSNGDVVKLAVNSSNEFRAYLNGVLRVGPVTDSAGSTNTKAGFEALSNGSTDRIDDWSWTDAGGALSASLTESATASDTASALLTSVASLTESATAADSIAAAAVLLATLTETASPADALAALLVAVADVAEPATAAELLSTGAQYAGAVLESVASAETLVAAATLVALLTEPATAADVAAAAYPATYNVSVAELASALEQLVAVLGTEVFTAPARTRIGPATLADALERIGSRTTAAGLTARVGGKSI